MEINIKGIDKEMHRKIAATLFNQTWDLIEKTRNSDENDLMISVSQASLFHWRFAGGGDLELSRGHWIISRVYSILSMPESAIYHGNKCLEFCRSGNLEDFEYGFACEALARAHYVKGELGEYDKYLKMAISYAEKIKEQDYRKWLETNINEIESRQKN